MAVHEPTAWAKLHRLRAGLASLGTAVTAYSGGADSTFLAATAHHALGERALAVTADSPSLPRSELSAAVALAARIGMRHEVVATSELNNPAYARNDGDRCYFCKESLMAALRAVADATGAAHVLVGVNTDDLGDYRPGQQAVREQGGRWPLVEAGLSKNEIRWLSQQLALPTWDKPAAACLSSRLAYGVAVTAAALTRVEAAEAALHRLGLRRVRVRDQGNDLARIETDPADLPVLVFARTEVVAALKEAGFVYVTVDLEGYRQGSHNAALPLRQPGSRPSVGGA